MPQKKLKSEENLSADSLRTRARGKITAKQKSADQKIWPPFVSAMKAGSVLSEAMSC